MKSLIVSFCFVITTIGLLAQTPQAFKYQAVARDASGTVLENQGISVKFSVRNNSPSGTLLYEETHSVTTNQLGLFNLNIGRGNPVSGDFAQISWGVGEKWLTVGIDPAGGSNFIEMGSSQLLAVPYALYADSANVPGVPGPVGDDGFSAYEIWLSLGNTGSEADFIASLEGPAGQDGAAGQDGDDGLSAYEVWLNLGNTGSEADFIASLEGPAGQDGADGTDGQDGDDGLSAYEVWLNLGNTGSEADFIASLEGPAGQDGADGDDGLSAYEVWLNLGNTGSEADFIASLEGPAGQDGEDGAAKAAKHAGYDWAGGFPTITSTSWEMWDFSSISAYGDANVTVTPDDIVHVTVSAMVYRASSSSSDNLRVELCPCHSSTFTSPTISTFSGRTQGRFVSTGISEMHHISSSYMFTGLNGNLNFSLCFRKDLSTSGDFSIYSPKVNVVVY